VLVWTRLGSQRAPQRSRRRYRNGLAQEQHHGLPAHPAGDPGGAPIEYLDRSEAGVSPSFGGHLLFANSRAAGVELTGSQLAAYSGAVASPAVNDRDDRQADAVFKALGDRSRRLLLDALRERNGQTLTELCAGLLMARQSVSKHLGVLEAAMLVTTVRRGREKLHYLNPAPINEIAERWISQYDQERVRALSDLKRALEDTV
jgi:DNA-binding transcriptional ArsR family regulator